MQSITEVQGSFFSLKTQLICELNYINMLYPPQHKLYEVQLSMLQNIWANYKERNFIQKHIYKQK